MYIGTFGKVYNGVYTKDKNSFQVAIKTLRGKYNHLFVCSYVANIIYDYTYSC